MLIVHLAKNDQAINKLYSLCPNNVLHLTSTKKWGYFKLLGKWDNRTLVQFKDGRIFIGSGRVGDAWISLYESFRFESDIKEFEEKFEGLGQHDRHLIKPDPKK